MCALLHKLSSKLPVDTLFKSKLILLKGAQVELYPFKLEVGVKIKYHKLRKKVRKCNIPKIIKTTTTDLCLVSTIFDSELSECLLNEKRIVFLNQISGPSLPEWKQNICRRIARVGDVYYHENSYRPDQWYRGKHR